MGAWETPPALLSLASVKRTRSVTRSSLSSTNNIRSNKEHRFVVAQLELALARAASDRYCKHSDVLSGVSRVCIVKLNPRDSTQSSAPSVKNHEESRYEIETVGAKDSR